MTKERNYLAKNEQEVRTNLNTLINEGYLSVDEKEIIIDEFAKVEKEWNKFSSKVVENFNKFNDEVDEFLFSILNKVTKDKISRNILTTYVKMELEKIKIEEYYYLDGLNYHTATDAAIKILYSLIENKYNNVGYGYSANDVKKYQEALGLTSIEVFQMLFNCTKTEAMNLTLMSGNFDVPYDHDLNKYKTTYVVMTWMKYFNVEDLPMLKKHKKLHELLENMMLNKEQAANIALQIAEL